MTYKRLRWLIYPALVLVAVANCGKSTGNTYLNIKLLRNSTEIVYINGAAMTQTTVEQNQNVTMNYLDRKSVV